MNEQEILEVQVRAAAEVKADPVESEDEQKNQMKLRLIGELGQQIREAYMRDFDLVANAALLAQMQIKPGQKPKVFKTKQIVITVTPDEKTPLVKVPGRKNK